MPRLTSSTGSSGLGSADSNTISDILVSGDVASNNLDRKPIEVVITNTVPLSAAVLSSSAGTTSSGKLELR